MIIRHATQADLEGIAAVQAESWKDAYKDILPTQFLTEAIDRKLARHWRETDIKSDDLILLAEEDAIAGFIAVWCRPIPFIDNLHVRPSCRSQKTGSALLTAAASELIPKGHKTAFLWVFESNTKAIRFYERFGGVRKELAMKTVFGYEIPSRKIQWDDLTVICDILKGNHAY